MRKLSRKNETAHHQYAAKTSSPSPSDDPPPSWCHTSSQLSPSPARGQRLTVVDGGRRGGRRVRVLQHRRQVHVDETRPPHTVPVLTDRLDPHLGVAQESRACGACRSAAPPAQCEASDSTANGAHAFSVGGK